MAKERAVERAVLRIGQLAVGAYLLVGGAKLVDNDDFLPVLLACVSAAFGIGLLIRTLRRDNT
jgi:hypothetical protein